MTSDRPRTVAVCDSPSELMYFTITFRSFTPTPGGMEFLPGRNYYFISTSSSDDLHQKRGGKCLTHNMKVAFKVADNTEQSSVNVPRHFSPPLLGSHYPQGDQGYPAYTNEVSPPSDIIDHRLMAEAQPIHGSSESFKPLPILLITSLMVANLL